MTSTDNDVMSRSPENGSNECRASPNEEARALQQRAESAVETFIRNNPRPETTHETMPKPRLTKPVVVPQRRPGNKERGFVKAYAPDLEAFGIDQSSFLEFIGAVNKAVQASKWLHAVQVAAFGTGFIPNHIALGVSAAVQVIAGIVAKTETRWKYDCSLRSSLLSKLTK